MAGLTALQDNESPPQVLNNAIAEKKPEVRPKKAANATPQRASKARVSVADPNIPGSRAEPITASQEATSGIGGPYVPAVYVQVSSQRNEKDAVQAARVLQASFPDIVGRVSIMRADLGTKGIYYRAQIGPFIPQQAERLCNNLKAAGGQCFVQRN